MRDSLSIVRAKMLHPKWRADAISFVESCEEKFNSSFRIVQGLRTFAEQDLIYAKGRTAPGKIVTYAKGGQTYHNYGLAIDIVPITNGDVNWNFNYELLREFAIKYNIQMGIDFPHPDYDHFEQKYGLNWRGMLAKYNAKDFITGTQYINI